MDSSTIVAIILIVVGLAIVLFSIILSEKYRYKDDDKEEDMSKLSNSMLAKQEDEISDFTNQKMTAINEYYSFVVEEIDKKHRELLFLYHMISEKEKDVQKSVQDASLIMNEIMTEREKLKKQLEQFHKSSQLQISQEGNTLQENKPIKENKIPQENKPLQDNVKVVYRDVYDSNVTHTLDNKGDDNDQEITSNNEIILELHKQGNSVKEIAYKLGLGIGEVKLVIDLFSEVNR